MMYGIHRELSSAQETFQRRRFTGYFPALVLCFSSVRWLGYIWHMYVYIYIFKYTLSLYIYM